MCRIAMAHTLKHRITSKNLIERLGVGSFDSYYNRRLLRWAGHVARMPMDRMPRKLLTGWVEHGRLPAQTIGGRTLNKALKSYDLPTNFEKWSTLAADRVGLAAADQRSAPLPASSNDFDTRQMARAFRRPKIMPLSLLLKQNIFFRRLLLG